MKVSILSPEKVLIEEFTSQTLAALRLETTPKTLRRYINKELLFKGKFFLRSSNVDSV
jgi:hypothetical protein